MTTIRHDSDKLTAWMREAADEIDKAHVILDNYEVPRSLTNDGVEMTLAARINYVIEALKVHFGIR